MPTEPSFSRSDFPSDFLFGTATSAYQIEGHSFAGAGRTHWDSFAETPGNVVRAENGSIACDHYHRFASDLDLVQRAGFDCYRFSTSWARIIPDGFGKINQQGLDFYDRLVDGLLERGLKPCTTLYHWELPSSLADLGGWCNRDTSNWFADFTEVVMKCIGDRVFSAAPINEPWCVSWLGHFLGLHAPGLRDIRATARAMHHVLLAHGRSIQAMRALGIKNLGAVLNFEWMQPASQNNADIAAAALNDAIFNRFFIQGMTQGSYPDIVVEKLEEHLPSNWHKDFETIGEPLDWCGINYYTRKNIKQDKALWPSLKEVPGELPKTATDWEIYPKGLYKILHRLVQEYTGSLPLYVTENGLASHDHISNGIINDSQRIEYLVQHIAEIKRAISEKIPLKGYFVWSLLDNYEWAYGYEKRFGLVHVDFETLERTPKKSYWLLKKALEK